MPVMKKKGSTCAMSSAVQALRRPYRRSVSRKTNSDVSSDPAKARIRTPNSRFPKMAVPNEISHATMGGWSR